MDIVGVWGGCKAKCCASALFQVRRDDSEAPIYIKILAYQ